MLLDPNDTIAALSSAHGPGARAIVRLSGPHAWAIATRQFAMPTTARPEQRLLQSGRIRLEGLASELEGDLYFWPAPRSYTGQDVAEIHTLSSPPLVELLVAACLNAGARAAQPGEFTMRAFLAGKLDLPKAEAILGVIEAGDRDELKSALTQLAGGVSRPLAQVRDDLLNLLADIEAGLDFTEEGIEFVKQKELLDRLARALALVTLMRRQLEQRATGPRPFRAVLAGPPNAGKSSLFNALIQKDAALVNSKPGTTRDYLEATLFTGGAQVLLIDTAGLREAGDALEQAAQDLGKSQALDADLILHCREAGGANESGQAGDWRCQVMHIATKCDRGQAPEGSWPTSAVTGIGLPELREELAKRALSRKQSALAPSLSRCRHHVDACLGHLRQAHSLVLDEDPAEILAVEVCGALDELGAMVGAVYTDDLLDRIFSRFCVGK